MKSNHINRRKRPESGVALLVAIFVLMLISVIAISLIIGSGGESALEGNYRSSASAYLAGTAGLEEARGRMLKKNADYFNQAPNDTPATTFIPTAGPLAIGQVRYVLNPGPGETAGDFACDLSRQRVRGGVWRGSRCRERADDRFGFHGGFWRDHLLRAAVQVGAHYTGYGAIHPDER